MRLDFLFEKSVEMCRKKLNGETKDTMMKITKMDLERSIKQQPLFIFIIKIRQ